jgi:hypothetical protein
MSTYTVHLVEYSCRKVVEEQDGQDDDGEGIVRCVGNMYTQPAPYSAFSVA